MTTRIYKSTDPGAPQLRVATTSPVTDANRPQFVEILQACLVDGYGTRAPAGWELAWDENDAKAFNVTGRPEVQYVFKENHNLGSTDGSAVEAYVCTGSTGYRVGEDDAWPAAISDDVRSWITTRGSNSGAETLGWTIVASETYFYFLKNFMYSSTTSGGLFFGEYTSRFPVKGYNNIVMFSYVGPSSSGDDNANLSAGLFNSIGSSGYRYIGGDWAGVSSYTGLKWFSDDIAVYDNKLAIDTVTGNLLIMDYNIYTAGTGVHMGKMPGTYSTLVSGASSGIPLGIASMPDGLVTPGKKYISCRVDKSSHRTLIIEYDE